MVIVASACVSASAIPGRLLRKRIDCLVGFLQPAMQEPSIVLSPTATDYFEGSL
jgi:hypothetical protein